MRRRLPSFFLMKTGDAMGGLDGHMHWLLILKEVVQLLLLNWSQGVDLGAECLGVRDKFHGMFPLPVQELIKGFLGQEVFELLIVLWHYILKKCHMGLPFHP